MGVPGVSSDTDGLLAEYGSVRTASSARERARRLGGLAVRSLHRSGISAARREDGPLVTVAFRYSGHPYVLGLAQVAEWELPAGEASVQETRRSAPGASVIVLSMSGFAGPHVKEVAGNDSGRTVLWDRTHLEAVLCGLVSLPDLLDSSVNAAFFRNAAYEPLARLLENPGDDAPPRMTTPDQQPPPWPVLDSAHTQTGVRLVLIGEPGWSRPSGIATLGPGRLAVVTGDGLVDLDAVRGTTSWLTRLPGCVNEPLVLPDGSVLTVRGRAVARVTGAGIEAVAGEFDGSPRLLAGPGGEPWVLSGRGSDLPGEGTLSLTRLGERAGDQHRYRIDCAGDVHAAAWLGGLRFFLAAPGRSTVIDLSQSTHVAESGWIQAPGARPQYLTADSPGSVVTVAVSPYGKPDDNAAGPAARVTLFRTDLSTRATQPVTELALNGASGLCTDTDTSRYLLGDVGTKPEAWPVLVRLPGHRAAPATAPARIPAQALPPDTALPRSRWDAVRMAARGREQDYELDPRPIDRGGQAEVSGARHRQTGVRVAFKRLRRREPHTVARMRREIEAAQVLGGNPHVMPVLDFGPRHDWFVMPLAVESAATAQPALRDPAELRVLVTAICEGLRHAHDIGWIHRDLKPANLLRLDGTWTVADWGLVRRPLGATTQPGRTRLGAAFGTVGFGAPELAADPHHAGPRADIYSIGQIIGWAVTGQMPQANTPLLPPDGPWRQVVRAATQHDAARRPATVDALLHLIAEELDYKRPDTSEAAARLSAAASDGDAQAAVELFALAARYPDDTLLYTQTLPGMSRDAVIAAVDSTRHDTVELTRAMNARAHDTGLDPDQAARMTTLLHWIQARACDARDLGLLEEVTRAVLAWDEHWNQETPQREIARWLPLQRGDQAAAVARALRETPGSARHFTAVLHDDRADERIQRAIRAALNLSPGSVSVPADAVPATADAGAAAVDAERCLPVQPITVPGRREPPAEDPVPGDAGALFARCTPDEQALWRRLSVFSGMFDADAAEQVCADAALDSGTVLEALAGLAAKSVVTVQESARGARYRLPEAARELGAKRLSASGHEKLFRGRHFTCYLALARRFAGRFLDQDGAALLRQVRASYPDIRAALEYASSGELGVTAQGTGAAGLAAALSDFWRADGQLREGRDWLRRTAESCPYPSRELAQALVVRGHLGAVAGEARDAVAEIRQGIRIAAALGDPAVAALGHLHLTQALTFAEYYEEAAAAGTEAYHQLRRLDDDLGRLRLQAELASLETFAGSPEQAVTRCANALRKAPSAGGWIRGYLHAVMAFAQLQQGKEAECEASIRTALRAYQEFGDRTGIAYALELLGWLAARAGRHTRTAWLLGAAGRMWEAAGSRLSKVPTMEELHVTAEATARGALSQRRFAGIQAMGADSPLNEVIAFAIGDVSIQVW